MKYKFCVVFTVFVFSNLFSQNKLKVGDIAPNIVYTSILQNESKEINFNNKFIVLEFWATWCGPCLEVVPHLNKLQEKFKDNKNLLFVSITNERRDYVSKFLNKFKFTSTVITDESGKTIKNFIEDNNGSFSIPKTILIDNKGLIKWIGTPTQLNENFIENFLAGNRLNQIDESLTVQLKEPEITQNQSRTERIEDVAYKTMYDQANICSFILLNSNSANGSMTINTLNEDGAYFVLDKSLISVLSDLLNVLENQIVIPKEIIDKRISFFYKNIYKKDELKMKRDIKEQIIRSFNLKENVSNVDCQGYKLVISDKSKLVPILNETESSKTTKNSYFMFSNVQTETIVNQISNFFDVIVKDETNLKEKYDFILKNDSLENTKNDLKTYGLNLLETKIKSKKYSYENVFE